MNVEQFKTSCFRSMIERETDRSDGDLSVDPASHMRPMKHRGRGRKEGVEGNLCGSNEKSLRVIFYSR